MFTFYGSKTETDGDDLSSSNVQGTCPFLHDDDDVMIPMRMFRMKMWFYLIFAVCVKQILVIFRGLSVLVH